jgi:septal ring factor EnvC (AmiA/AmiB activator)
MNSFQLKKIIKVFIWLNIFIFSLLCLAENNITKTEESLLKLQKEINQLDKNIKKNTATKNNLSNQLKKKERKISKTKKQLYKIKKKFKNNKKKINQLNKQLAKLKKEIKIKKRSLSSRLYQTYTQGSPGYLQMYLDGINPSQISRESYYIGYYSQQQNNDIESIKKAYKKIDKTKKSTNKILKKVASLKKQKERNAKKLQKQKKEKTIVIKKINAKLSSQKKKKKKLIKNEKKLNSIVTELIKKIKAESKKKTITEKIHAKKESTSDDKFDGINFKKLKGKLKLPVKGKITKKFNSKRKDTGTRWKGIFIKSKEGNEVYSVASGKIVFSDWLDGYGNIIIIDHGKGYMSLYGNNQSLIKQQGDIIKGGSIIAIVGNSGGNSTNGLYYQLRKNSKPFNPLKWTKLK